MKVNTVGLFWWVEFIMGKQYLIASEQVVGNLIIQLIYFRILQADDGALWDEYLFREKSGYTKLMSSSTDVVVRTKGGEIRPLLFSSAVQFPTVSMNLQK